MRVNIADNHEILVDLEDASLAACHRWTLTNDFSFQNRSRGEDHLLHRLIFGRKLGVRLKPGVVVKFRNGDRFDLRRHNLFSPRIGDPQDDN